MPDLRMHMPPALTSSVALATHVLDSKVPPWAASRADLTLLHGGTPEHVAGRRALSDIFRLPHSNPAVRAWLYTRPDTEVVDEATFANSAVESSTIFRFQACGSDGSFEVSPTVSNHWLMVPVQSLNGVTVGLTYLDILYDREGDVSRVPPLRFGKFAIDDSTGEVFITGWQAGIMVVGWVQSILKCERVRELLMYPAPPVNGQAPRHLLVRNSFFERRDCKLCGVAPNGKVPSSMRELLTLPPCSGVRNALQHDPAVPAPLTNVATLYRRFRGSYFGVCLKTAFSEGLVVDQSLVSVFVDIRRGLHDVKRRFKDNFKAKAFLSTTRLFGLHPLTSSRVFFIQSNSPVDSAPQPVEGVCGRRKPKSASWEQRRLPADQMSPVSSSRNSTSRTSSAASNDVLGKTQRRRVRGDDTAVRDTPEFARKMRNRAAAEKSNRIRRERHLRKVKELHDLKERIKLLRKRKQGLLDEQSVLVQLTRKVESQADEAGEMMLDEYRFDILDPFGEG